jgi:predicted ATPase
MDSASYCLDEVSKSFKVHADLVSEDLYLGSMVMLKSGLNQYEDAIQFCLRALVAVKKNDDHQISVFNYYQYAIVLQKTNKFAV